MTTLRDGVYIAVQTDAAAISRIIDDILTVGWVCFGVDNFIMSEIIKATLFSWKLKWYKTALGTNIVLTRYLEPAIDGPDNKNDKYKDSNTASS